MKDLFDLTGRMALVTGGAQGLGPCTPLVADLATAEEASQLARECTRAVSRCDILVNNAGKSWGAWLESFPDKITVNALVPGYFPTRMTAHMRHDGGVKFDALAHIPLHSFGQPDDVAGAVVFLCPRDRSNVTGAQLALDGGILGCT